MAGNRTADELLKWSLRQEGNSQGPSRAQIAEEIAQGKRPDLTDPKLFDALMGKSEAQMMQEELAVALDEKRDEEDRCTALDNFEMLIESIDNANNMQNMKMWPPLLSLLNPSSHNTPSIQTATLWIIGTAIQNNPKAQSVLLSQTSPEPLSLILNLLKDQDGGVRSKAMYALSAMLKLHGKALVKFEGMGGWEVLKQALRDPEINLRRKTAFLLSTLLMQDESVPDSTPSTTTATSSTPTPPAGLLGPAPPNSTNTHPTSTTNIESRATAVAPSSTSASSSGPGPAPLEVDPTSLLSDAASPNIATALLKSGLLKVLILSILQSAHSERDEEESFSLAGQDGDLDPAEDLDYSEKSLNAILVWVKKFKGESLKDQDLKSLLAKLQSEMEGAGKEGSDQRWKELNVENDDWKEFQQTLRGWGV